MLPTLGSSLTGFAVVKHFRMLLAGWSTAEGWSSSVFANRGIQATEKALD